MPEAARTDESLLRAIGPAGLTASVVNIVVGGGIFVLPAILATELGGAAPLAYVLAQATSGWQPFVQLACLLAVPGLLWVLAYSTRQEFFAIGAVLLAGSAACWLATRKGRRQPLRGGHARLRR